MESRVMVGETRNQKKINITPPTNAKVAAASSRIWALKNDQGQHAGGRLVVSGWEFHGGEGGRAENSVTWGKKRGTHPEQTIVNVSGWRGGVERVGLSVLSNIRNDGAGGWLFTVAEPCV